VKRSKKALETIPNNELKMEAIVKQDFNATDDDESSFRWHSIIKALNKEGDMNWCRAELDGNDGAFVVRVGASSPGAFSLYFKCGDGVQHFENLRDAQGKIFNELLNLRV